VLVVVPALGACSAGPVSTVAASRPDRPTPSGTASAPAASPASSAPPASTAASSAGTPGLPAGAPTTAPTSAPLAAAAATPRVPPGRGWTAPVVGARLRPPVPPGKEALFSEGLAVRVTGESETTLTGRVPGEVSGPGVLVTVTFRNGSTVPVDLDGIRVTASGPGGVPASAVDGPPAQPPTGILAPGGTAQASFAFSLPRGSVRAMTLEITSISSADVVVVRG